ncbi:hypothetical protein T261_5871 [Streptomyces lydicus]|nr:hypothetical protein T261_5871 [Streptomyces lydicus]
MTAKPPVRPGIPPRKSPGNPPGGLRVRPPRSGPLPSPGQNGLTRPLTRRAPR